LKMSQCSLFGEEQELLQILPKSAMMHRGQLSGLTMWERGTEGNGYGLWPTPNAWDGQRGPRSAQNLKDKHHQINLVTAVKNDLGPQVFPTPRAREGNAGKSGSKGSIHNAKRGYLDGTVQEQQMFPTPTATERSGTNPKTGRGEGLSKVVKMFPTPSKGMYKQDVNDNGRYARWVQEKGYQVMLPAAVKIFPTPTATDSKTHWNDKKRFDSLTAEINRKKTEEQVTGQLNPTWVEWLMGYPTGWTDLKDLETQ